MQKDPSGDRLRNESAVEVDVPTDAGLGRRRFLTYLIAAPILTVACRSEQLDAPLPAETAGASQAPLGIPDIVDLGDALILAGALTVWNLALEVKPDNRIALRLPRAEVGQGITTTAAMLVAEELDARLADVEVALCDAEPEILFNQLTAGSNSVRSLYTPIRATAAAARARLVTAAAQLFKVPADKLTTKDTSVIAPDGRRATYGSLSAAASRIVLPAISPAPKDPSKFTVIGEPTTRIDAREIVTGNAKYTMDLDVPGAMPTVVARPPTIKGTVASFDASAARGMPGVLAITPIPTGIAVTAETFHQAFMARDALRITWNDGPIAALSDADITRKLTSALLPLAVPPVLSLHVDAEFDFAFVSHAPMEVLSAVADVRGGKADVWCSSKSPIIAQQTIAATLGMPQSAVTVHVVRGGGSFGRRLFFDAALEAAQVSKAIGRPVKLMWSRNDDTRHGRMRPASHHKLRATHLLGSVLTYEHRVAAVKTDLGHGLGEALTAIGFTLLGGVPNQLFFLLSENVPYNFGVTTQLLSEVPLEMHTGSWRSVYSGFVAVANEIMVDEIARALGKDPVAFRKSTLSSSRAKAVLAKVASAGHWGRTMPPGTAQGVALHEEYKSCVACLVEIDTRDAANGPRVTKAVVAADVGRAINPRGLEAQLMGATTDGISVTLQAGLHIDKGAVREGSFSDFRYARMRNTPLEFEVHILPPSGEPGGAGELAYPAAAAAVANAYARATGTSPRRFPISG
ncbi:molybdopterin cofactor-binding domain-containing protein [Pendulispora albinea]|uniref:Molybdopterin-dependent oxidoreductase n=1 Tax=Pendulispora albinea TaxID=2741071 RepID=A0ABZ2M479_9BACT